MKYKHSCLVLAAILSACAFSAPAEEAWDYTKRRTLAELIELRREILTRRHPAFSPDEAANYALNNSGVPSAVEMIFVGAERELPAERKKLIDAFARSYAHISDFAEDFQVEMPFKEGQTEYWMPVNKKYVAAMRQLPKGAEVIFSADLIGAHRGAQGWEWVCTMNVL